MRLTETATAKAVMVWPDGNENRSGCSSVAQQCGSSAQGRLRPVAFFRLRKAAIPTPAASAAAPIAANRRLPPSNRIARPSAYHSHPSPPRVAHTIQTRIQRGACQRWTRRIRVWSLSEMSVSVAASVIPLNLYTADGYSWLTSRGGQRPAPGDGAAAEPFRDPHGELAGAARFARRFPQSHRLAPRGRL